MQLQTRQRPHVIDSALDALLQRERLVRTRDDNHHLARVKHRLNADRQRHSGHLVDVVVEEARVCHNGIIGQRLDSCARGETRSWFVKGNVAVWTDAAEEELNAAGALDLFFVGDAFGFEVLRVAIENVYVGRVDVDVGKEVSVHEGVVGFGVIAWDADVFVLLYSHYF